MSTLNKIYWKKNMKMNANQRLDVSSLASFLVILSIWRSFKELFAEYVENIEILNWYKL